MNADVTALIALVHAAIGGSLAQNSGDPPQHVGVCDDFVRAYLKRSEPLAKRVIFSQVLTQAFLDHRVIEYVVHDRRVSDRRPVFQPFFRQRPESLVQVGGGARRLVTGQQPGQHFGNEFGVSVEKFPIKPDRQLVIFRIKGNIGTHQHRARIVFVYLFRLAQPSPGLPSLSLIDTKLREFAIIVRDNRRLATHFPGLQLTPGFYRPSPFLLQLIN